MITDVASQSTAMMIATVRGPVTPKERFDRDSAGPGAEGGAAVERGAGAAAASVGAACAKRTASPVPTGGTHIPAMPSRNMRMKLATAFVAAGGAGEGESVAASQRTVRRGCADDRPRAARGRGPPTAGVPSGALLTAVVGIGVK